MISLIDRLSSRYRVLLLVIFDTFITVSTLTLAIGLKFPIQQVPIFLVQNWWVFPILLFFRIGTFQSYGLYAFLWRYASVKELLIIVKAVTLSSLFTSSI